MASGASTQQLSHDEVKSARCQLKRSFRIVSSTSKRAIRGAEGFQVSKRGAYSIERLQAFAEYCRTTSQFRVLGICLVTPIPALLVAIARECIPLQNPTLGWRENYGAFIRDGIMFFCTCFGVCVQTTALVPILSLSTVRVIMISVATAMCSISLRILVAEIWAYPIPFGYAWGAAPHSLFYMIFFACAVGRKQFQEKPSLLRELWNQWITVSVLVLLCFIYPAYNAVYLRLDSSHQTMFIFILPLLKIVLQNILAWSMKHIVEYMPGVTIFSVELFNSLYLAKCMQNAGSITTFAVVVSLDVVKSILTYRSMKTRALRMYQLTARNNRKNRILDTLMALCQDPDAVVREGSQIRILSPITLTRRPSLTNAEILHSLVRRQSFDWTPCEPSQGAVLESSGAFKSTCNHVDNARNLSSWQFQLPGQDAAMFIESNLIESMQINTPGAPSDAHIQSTDNTGPTETKQQSLFTAEHIGNKVYPSIKTMDESNALDISTSQCSTFFQPRIYSAVTTNHNLPKGISKLDMALKKTSRTASSLNTVHPARQFIRSSKVQPFKCRFGKTIPMSRKCKQSPMPSTNISAFTTCEKHEILDQSLKLLFQCEYHALARYVEVTTPMLYCVYVGVLANLPSRSYYPEMRHMTVTGLDQMVLKIFTFASFEIVAFAALHFSTKWRFGFSPVYLLAFVLENRAIEFQARLLVWFSYILEFTLVHNGMCLYVVHCTVSSLCLAYKTFVCTVRRG